MYHISKTLELFGKLQTFTICTLFTVASKKRITVIMKDTKNEKKRLKSNASLDQMTSLLCLLIWRILWRSFKYFIQLYIGNSISLKYLYYMYSNFFKINFCIPSSTVKTLIIKNTWSVSLVSEQPHRGYWSIKYIQLYSFQLNSPFLADLENLLMT